ncbi:MAG: DUF1003 domain-containing protein [Candidatus Gastranaerophilaceae bacterium]|jgi:uncharacterized membrane protein
MKIDTDKLIIKITDAISTINALKIVVLIIVFWLIFGQVTKIDPYPYMFSSTVANYSGFILTIVILIATKALEKLQKESEKREKEHQEQHYKIQKMEEKLVKQLHETQEKQNAMLLEIAKKLNIEV